MSENTRLEAMLEKHGVNTAGNCWWWTKGKDKDGYGKVKISGRTLRAHRLIWECVHGPIPANAILCHRCDEPSCVNPHHLFLGDHAVNHKDRGMKGRSAAGEAHGRAKLTAAHVLEIRTSQPGYKAAAAVYGIGKTHYHRILRGQAWSNTNVI